MSDVDTPVAGSEAVEMAGVNTEALAKALADKLKYLSGQSTTQTYFAAVRNVAVDLSREIVGSVSQDINSKTTSSKFANISVHRRVFPALGVRDHRHHFTGGSTEVAVSRPA